MKRYQCFAFSITALSLMLTGVGRAQGPAGDQIKITFDRAVAVGSHSLPAGEYLIRQVTSGSNPRVLEFTSKNGTQLDATVTAIPIMQNTAPTETKVILDEEGGTPRLARIWVQGKNYGYAFPGTAASAVQTAANAGRLEGRYTAETANNSAERAAAPEPAPQPRAETPAPTPAPEPQQQAQAQPQPEAPAPQPAPAESTPQPAPTAMPATALGWADAVGAGLLLMAAGLLMRLRAARASE